jgi:hypothetical protein
MSNFMAGYKRPENVQTRLESALARAMRNHPEQRLGQIIANVMSAAGEPNGLFQIYDEKLTELLFNY